MLFASLEGEFCYDRADSVTTESQALAQSNYDTPRFQPIQTLAHEHAE